MTARREQSGVISGLALYHGDQCNAVASGVVNRPTLEAVGRKQDALVSTDRSESVGQNLNIFAFDGSNVVLALDQYEEVHTELAESQAGVDSILTVWCGHQFLTLHFEVWQIAAHRGEDIGHKPLELTAVKAGSTITARHKVHKASQTPVHVAAGGLVIVILAFHCLHEGLLHVRQALAPVHIESRRLDRRQVFGQVFVRTSCDPLLKKSQERSMVEDGSQCVTRLGQ